MVLFCGKTKNIPHFWRDHCPYNQKGVLLLPNNCAKLGEKILQKRTCVSLKQLLAWMPLSMPILPQPQLADGAAHLHTRFDIHHCWWYRPGWLDQYQLEKEQVPSQEYLNFCYFVRKNVLKKCVENAQMPNFSKNSTHPMNDSYQCDIGV